MLDNLIQEYEEMQSSLEVLKSRGKVYVIKSAIIGLSANALILIISIVFGLSAQFLILSLVLTLPVLLLINIFNKDYRKLLDLERNIVDHETLIFDEMLQKYEDLYNNTLFRFLDEYKPKLVSNLMLFKSNKEVAIFADWNTIKRDLKKKILKFNPTDQSIDGTNLDDYYLIIPNIDIIGTIRKKRVINEELNTSKLNLLNSSIKKNAYYVELKYKVDRQSKSIFLPMESLEYLSDV